MQKWEEMLLLMEVERYDRQGVSKPGKKGMHSGELTRLDMNVNYSMK